MEKQISVRRAENRDIPGMIRLLYQVNQIHADGRPDLFKSNGIKYNDKQLAEKLSDTGEEIYVAVNDSDEVLGYVFGVYECTPETESTYPVKSLYIDDLCVDHELRTQHIGRTLYEHICKVAREKHCDRIILHVWECNSNAAGFYEALGMKPLYTVMEQPL